MDLLSRLSDALTSLVGDYALYAVFLLMLIDAVLPAASELVMVYGGAVAAGAFAGESVVFFGDPVSEGWWSFLAIAVSGTVGYTLGSLGGWLIGYHGGRPLLERHGRWLHLSPPRLAHAEQWFERFGDAAVFLGRITPLVRSFISIPAGVFRHAFGRYTALTLVGSALWCFALAGIGWGLGSNWERFHHAFRYVEYAAVAVIAAGLVWLVVRFRRGRARRRALT